MYARRTIAFRGVIVNPIENVWIVVRSTKNGSFGASWRPYHHKTYESAEVEANRLAAKHPGIRFFIFQMLSKTDKCKPLVVEPALVLTDDERALLAVL